MKKLFLLLACCTVFFSAPAQHIAIGVPPLEYEKGAFDLPPIYESVLDKVMEVLTLEPTYMVLIDGHASIDEGSKAANDTLSLKRAQAVEKYFTDNGVDASRLRATGYGDNLLLNECPEKEHCTEEEHAKNRRVELVVKENPYIVID